MWPPTSFPWGLFWGPMKKTFKRPYLKITFGTNMTSLKNPAALMSLHFNLHGGCNLKLVWSQKTANLCPKWLYTRVSQKLKLLPQYTQRYMPPACCKLRSKKSSSMGIFSQKMTLSGASFSIDLSIFG